MMGGGPIYDGALQPQLLPDELDIHCADAVLQKLRTVRALNNEAGPNDDRGMETFLPEDVVRKR